MSSFVRQDLEDLQDLQDGFASWGIVIDSIVIRNLQQSKSQKFALQHSRDFFNYLDDLKGSDQRSPFKW
jgi:hypothetical protein